MSKRSRARALADEAIRRGEPCAWFETLYRESAEAGEPVPWADLVPNPHLVAWLETHPLNAPSLRATRERARVLDVGCGYGDNAAELARRGAEVTAFDISEHAVARAEQRFPGIDYRVVDARSPPDAWRGAFDLVAEIYTLQVLPPGPRTTLAAQLASFLRPGGTLLIICRGRDEGSKAPTGLPWPLTRSELQQIARVNGLSVASFDSLMDDETPPVRRFVVTMVKGNRPP